MKLEDILSKGFPTTREEAWKYTNVAEIASRPIVFSEKKSVDFMNSEKISSLKKEAAELSNDVFENLNQYFSTEDYEIVFSKTRGEPLEIIYKGEAEKWVQPRIKIKIAENVKAVVIEKFLSQNAQVTNAVTMIEVGPKAELIYIKVQEEHESAFHIGRTHISVAEQAKVQTLTLSRGAKLSRSDIHLKLSGEGAEADLNGLTYGKNRMHVDHHTLIEHCVPHTKSRQLYRSILDHHSRGVFNGKIIVRPNAHKTEAEQANHHLLLSKEAEIDAKPELEIYHDDVKCKHGATIGQLDESAMFYLQTRGLSQAAARDMLVNAFGNKVLDCIQDKSLRETLWPV